MISLLFFVFGLGLTVIIFKWYVKLQSLPPGPIFPTPILRYRICICRFAHNVTRVWQNKNRFWIFASVPWQNLHNWFLSASYLKINPSTTNIISDICFGRNSSVKLIWKSSQSWKKNMMEFFLFMLVTSEWLLCLTLKKFRLHKYIISHYLFTLFVK